MDFKIFLFVIASFILVTSIYNHIILRRINSLAKKRNPIINDGRYFELKYKIELYVIVISLIYAISGFLGYSFYIKFNERVNNDYKIVADQKDSILVHYNKLKERIDSTAKQELSGLYLFIVPNIKISNSETQKIYYKNMISSSGKKLPKITKTPYIQVAGDITVQIIDINTEFVEFAVLGSHTYNGKEKTDLWIATYDTY